MRVYISVADFTATALGAYWTRQTSGSQLDRALAQASEDVDNYCRRRLLAPAGTGAIAAATLAAGVGPGVLALAVNTVVGFDPDQQMAVLVDTGASQERLPLLGVSVSSWMAPYPGTLYLGSATALTHNSGAVVTGLYLEQWTLKGDSDMVMLSDGTVLRNREVPGLGYASLSVNRVIRLTNPPIVTIQGATYTYNGDPSTLTTLALTDPTTGLVAYELNQWQGWYRMPVTASVPEQGATVQTYYTGGFATCPTDLQDAVGLFAAHRLATGQAMVAQDFDTQRNQERSIVQSGSGPLLRRARDYLDSLYRKKLIG